VEGRVSANWDSHSKSKPKGGGSKANTVKIRTVCSKTARRKSINQWTEGVRQARKRHRKGK